MAECDEVIRFGYDKILPVCCFDELGHSLRTLGLNRGRRFREPNELRVRVRQARPGHAALVDQRVDVRRAGCGHARMPSFGDEGDLLIVEVGERADVARRVDDDLLALEGWIEVGDDPYAPARRVRLAPLGRQCKDLGWRAVLASLAEGAGLELFRSLRLDLAGRRARPAGPRRSEGDKASRERVDPQLRAQDVAGERSRNGFSRSSGAGKTIVVDCEAPSSSRVCR
jgi:hypothetical protein